MSSSSLLRKSHITVEYGRDMRMLVKHGTEKTFTEPRISRSDDTTPGSMEKYKTELRNFHREKKNFKTAKQRYLLSFLDSALTL
jgi:hypothetical protein